MIFAAAGWSLEQVGTELQMCIRDSTNGIFVEGNEVVHNLNFKRGYYLDAQTQAFNVKGVINNPDGYSIVLRI